MRHHLIVAISVLVVASAASAPAEATDLLGLDRCTGEKYNHHIGRNIPTADAGCFARQGPAAVTGCVGVATAQTVACNSVAARPLQVEAGAYHTCVRIGTQGKAPGDVDCYGFNHWGQSEDYLQGAAIDVATGDTYTCFLTVPWGQVFCHGEKTPYRFTGTKEIDAKRYTFCARAGDGNVWCQGSYKTGRLPAHLGIGDFDVSPGNACGVTASGDVYCTRERAIVYAGGDAKEVGVGEWHVCVLRESGDVECWALDETYVSPSSNVDYAGGDAAALDVGTHDNCILRTNGDVHCWGPNSEIVGTRAYRDAVDVQVGYEHACALRSDGAVDCWGDSRFGKTAPWPSPGLRVQSHGRCVAVGGWTC